MAPEPTPVWWVVSVDRHGDDGQIVRFAFRDRGPAEVWVPGNPPHPAELERLALMVLDPPAPPTKTGIQY